MYNLIKSFLFQMDAEKAHHLTIQILKTTEQFPLLIELLFGKPTIHPSLQREVFGLTFPNPVGLAAGLDKNAEVVDAMAMLGFGFVEIGTLTPKPQPGNDKPRLFRLIKDEALVNRMGFNNVGADLAAARLNNRKSNIIVGANIGKNKATPNEEAVLDYEYCFKTLFDSADYFVVNVSSPNTPGLRALQDKDALTKILASLQHINFGKPSPKPLLLKIAPDLTESQLDEVAEVVAATEIQGIVATNTTISREGLQTEKNIIENIGAGGLSGKPITNASTKVISYLNAQLSSHSTQLKTIAVGGIMNTEDAIEKLNTGSSLIQLYSGFIYKGPQLIKSINRSLITE
jgi:dihydroorotate dehydrogenase